MCLCTSAQSIRPPTDEEHTRGCIGTRSVGAVPAGGWKVLRLVSHGCGYEETDVVEAPPATTPLYVWEGTILGMSCALYSTAPPNPPVYGAANSCRGHRRQDAHLATLTSLMRGRQQAGNQCLGFVRATALRPLLSRQPVSLMEDDCFFPPDEQHPVDLACDALACGPSTDRYEGEWLEGQRHGHGTYTYASGSGYRGAWEHGLMHGRGCYTSANGRRYEGTYR